ncbi:MAG: hypothetical protein JWQ38_362 [Flavipsychrobacter sp.]|nr:hypothetical protein [Flavipsychrobacter sp.]
MRTKNLFTTMMAVCVIAAVSCTKKSSTTSTTTPTTTTTTSVTPTPVTTTTVTPTPTVVPGFKWVGNTTDTVVADSAYYASAYKTIKAFKNGTAKFIEINLTGGTAATYTVGSGNAISYIATGQSTTYVAATGSVVIDSVVGAKMYGSFTSTGTGAGLTSLSGKFISMDVR